MGIDNFLSPLDIALTLTACKPAAAYPCGAGMSLFRTKADVFVNGSAGSKVPRRIVHFKTDRLRLRPSRDTLCTTVLQHANFDSKE